MSTKVVNPNTQFGASGPDHAPGNVPDPGSTVGASKFLREDAAWQSVTKDNVGLGNVLNVVQEPALGNPASNGQVLSSTTSGTRSWITVSGGGATPYDSNPEMDGSAAPGTSSEYARGNHVHPSDTSRVPTSRTVNGHALSSDVTVTKSDVGLGSVLNTAQEPALGNPASNGYVLSSTTTGTRSWVAQPTLASLGAVPTSRQVNGHALSADVTVSKSDVGLGNCDNTSDANKPVSTAQQTALDAKVDKTTTVNGHALSANVTVTKGDVGLGNVSNVAQEPALGNPSSNGQVLSSTTTGTRSWVDQPTIASLGAVPTSRTVNGHALSADVTVSKSDVGLGNVTNTAQEPALGNPGSNGYVLSSTTAGVRSWVSQPTLSSLGAVPTTRTVNGHALSADVTVSKSDVGLGNVTNVAQEAALGNPASNGYVLSSTTTGTRSWVSQPTLASLGAVPTSRAVNGHALSADVTVSKSDVGLGNCDNTSDANKPISTATQTALNAKADGSSVVHNTGDEVISGVKTFSGTGTVMVLGEVGSTGKQLLFTINVTGNGYGSIQSIFQGTGYTPLILNRAGGNVGIGTNTPHSKLAVTGLPQYANNAAAIAGGLAAGDFYRTGGDPDPVCVVH